MNKIIVTMMMTKRFFIMLLFILTAGITYSQDDDFGIWLGVSAKHELLKKLDVELSGCVRTFNNTSQIEQSFLEGGIQYDPNKILSISGSYRLISKLEDDSKYYFRHKLFLDLKATLPSGNFSFSGRARIQRATKTYIKDDEDLISKYFGRFKLQAAYNTPAFPLKPYIYCEPFFPLFSDSGFKISKNRLCAGAELQISMKNSIEAEYIFQRDYTPHISDCHIISVNYKIKF
jgi:hypothetical protein